MRRILVTGSRDWDDETTIRDVLKQRIPYEDEWFLPIVMHGDAPGADRIAARHAFDLGYGVQAWPADWSRGKRAGPERNRRMLDQKPDLVLAFQRNGSRGTQDTIDEARRRGIPVEVHTAP